jgi:hypothetical protein
MAKALVRWEPEDEGKVHRYVDEALELVNADGSRTGANINAFDFRVRLLSHLITLTDIESLHEQAQWLGIALTGLKTSARPATPRLEQFREDLTGLVRQRQGRPSQLFQVILPLHSQEKQVEAVRAIRVLGVTLRVRSWDKLKRSGRPAFNEWLEKADDVVGHGRGGRVLMSAFVSVGSYSHRTVARARVGAGVPGLRPPSRSP